MANEDVITTSGITGSDGFSPIYNPNDSYHLWNWDEIFFGTDSDSPGKNRYVPKIDDGVMKKVPLIFYEVTNIDLATLKPTLRELKPISSDGEIDDEDVLVGPGPGTDSDTYRTYLNTAVVPHAVTVDRRCYVRGGDSSYARIFLGSDITDMSKVISHQYDSAGNIIGDKIPLELAEIDNTDNRTTKIIPTCYTMKDIPDGTRATVVFYSNTDIIVSKRQTWIENTGFVPSPNISVKYITGISLECPFISSDPRRIDLPQNVTLAGLYMTGVVNYSDGTKKKFPIDGTKFQIHGLNAFLTTVVGHEATITLRYRLSQGEISYTNQVGAFEHISQDYKVRVMQEDNAYSVKLFAYPVWQNSVSGYTLRYFLYNAQRDVMYDVTNYIQYSPGTPPFNPTQYGILQTFAVGVNLQQVNGSYRNYRHSQVIQLVLWGEGTMRTTNWSVYFDQNQNPAYGLNLHADLTFVNYNYYKLKVDFGAENKAEWLNRTYYACKPLIDQFKEQVPPVPTHFMIKVGNQEYVQNIDQWSDELVVGEGLSNNGTVFIHFLSRNPMTDLQLAVAAMPVYQTNPGSP